MSRAELVDDWDLAPGTTSTEPTRNPGATLILSHSS